MSNVWQDANEKGSKLLLLLAIADHADDDGYAWPGITHLARKIRMSERHTIRMIEQLEQSHELYVERGSGRTIHSRYIVLIGLSDEQIIKTLTLRFAKPDPEAQEILAQIRGKKGDNLSPFSDDKGERKGDKLSEKGDKLSKKGDIAMSPEPSVNRHLNYNSPTESLNPEKVGAGIARKNRRAPPKVIPAFKIFAEITGCYAVTKYWQSKMASTVGSEPENLDLWQRVVEGWTGCGWSKVNVKGMLERFENNNIPGQRNGAENAKHNDTTPSPIEQRLSKPGAYRL
jgi:hypothetical protein